jgi:hypothetical protein
MIRGPCSSAGFRTIQDRPKDFPPCLRHGELAANRPVELWEAGNGDV